MKKTILVVDDDPLNIKLFDEILMEEGKANFEILNANNGLNGLRIARKTLPHIIITDWHMPEMNGIELIRELKKEESTQEIPVLMATGVMMTSADLDIALGAGAVDYFRKPIDKVELRARVRSALEMADHIKELNHRNKIILDQEKVLWQNNIDKLKQELDYRQRQLAANISFITQLKNERDEQMESLNTLKPFLNAEGKNKLGELLKSMGGDEHNITLLELESRFEEVNRAFFEKLQKKFPEITKSEKLLCAFSVLKLSPTEISHITRKSLNTLNVGFSRIRAKVGVSTNTELNALLQNLE